MWHVGTWVSDGLGSAGLMAGLDDNDNYDDLKHIFQLKKFCDSTSEMIIPAGTVILL